MTRYPIRDPLRGEVVAYHVRTDGPSGKRLHWELPDGTAGLGGLKTLDLPLFGAAAAHRWDSDRPVIVTEGEKAAACAVAAGYQAVGTVTGASTCPDREPLMVLAGMRALLWPDNDRAGTMHMLMVARALRDDIAASVGWIVWDAAPASGDAADAFAVGGRDLLERLVATAGAAPTPQPSPAELIAFAQRQERRSRPVWHQVSLAPRSDVAPLARAVRSAGRSNRNAMLYWAARKANDDGIGHDVAEGVLLDAFLSDEPTPIREREGRRTIASAYRR
jgi:hypothetical protein